MRRANNPIIYRTHADNYNYLTITILARSQTVPFYFLYSQKK